MFCLYKKTRIQDQCGVHGVNGVLAVQHAVTPLEHAHVPVSMIILLISWRLVREAQVKMKIATSTHVVSNESMTLVVPTIFVNQN